jgi:diadenosine tetraphosphate (Ap4A) HIT family hydrolase
MDCIFCQIVEGKIPANLIYQDELLICLLDIDPINEGHVLIIPKTHYLDADEIPDEILLSIMTLSKGIVKAIKKIYSPDGYSIMQNGGEFNDIGHYHMHVFPRYKSDGFGWTFSGIKNNVSQAIANELRALLNRN